MLMKVNNLEQAPKVRTARGFSLLEMVIVLGIIALILGAAISFSGGITGAARDQAASAKMNEFSAKLETYRMVSGMYPSQNQGLQALVQKPPSAPEPRRWKQQFKELPKDPWNEDYIYYYPGKKDTSTYEIVSKGEDMEEGTDDDISSQDRK
ncbi:MAG: type II secretion system major pseudopilin GspG [Verrucomicrobia bacterium]|nr:type II secretion system major pseudopilin GspG [Verrucomicrobiota bacterium]